MPRKISNIEFQECIDHYYKVLKKSYLKEVENATDQDYAREHFQKILFLENQLVPYLSILFNELLITYNHLCRLNAENAYHRAIEYLPEIRNIAKTELNNSQQYLNGDIDNRLSEWYSMQIRNGSFSLKELIECETQVLAFTDENLIGALALHLAGEKLYNEFKDSEESEPKIKKHQYEFTRNEQLLALHFLIESFGVNPLQACDRTKLAALFHLIMGVPFEDKSKLKNLSIYKGLSIVPQVVNNDKNLLKYLQNIRIFFEEADFMQVVKLIDLQIEMCKTA